MNFADSKGDSNEPPSSSSGGGSFWSRMFGGGSERKAEEKKDNGDEKAHHHLDHHHHHHDNQSAADDHTHQDQTQVLTTAALEEHNDAISESKMSSIEGDRRSQASSISKSSRSSKVSRISRLSKVSRSSAGSRGGGGLGQGGHVGQHHHDTILEGNEDDELDENVLIFEDETIEDMHRRVTVEALRACGPPGQRTKFWQERRKQFEGMPLPSPPAPASYKDTTMPGTDTGTLLTPQPLVQHQGDNNSVVAEVSDGASPLRHGLAGPEKIDRPPEPPLNTLHASNREARIKFLRGILLPEQRATLERELKAQKQLHREYKHKLTLVTTKGEKKIPIKPPKMPPPGSSSYR
jgi:hypothetical protein